MEPFTTHTLDTAPGRSAGLIRATTTALGFTPAPVARMAESPELLEAFTTCNRLFQSGTLTPLEREVVVLTVVTAARCHYCVAMHTATLQRLGADPELVEALRAGDDLAETGPSALQRFCRAVLTTHGAVSDAQLDDFLSAGFTRGQALEVVLGIGTYTLSATANRLTRAPLDAPYQPYAWIEPDAA